MAASPRFKIYDDQDRYIGCVIEPDYAAPLLRDGWTIRDGHSKKATVWAEGKDGSASASYDRVMDVVYTRISARAANGSRYVSRH